MKEGKNALERQGEVLGIALPECQMHMKLQDGAERKGNPWGVVGSVSFNLAYLECCRRGYDNFKLESWILGKHC